MYRPESVGGRASQADAEVLRTTDHLLPLRNQLADLDLVRSGDPFLLYLCVSPSAWPRACGGDAAGS